MTAASIPEVPSSGGLFGLVRGASWPSRLAAIIGVLAIAFSSFTYAVVARLLPIEPTNQILVGMRLVILSLGVTLAALIAWRLAMLWTQRRSGHAGAKLHVRLVLIFSTIAVVPAILVGIFAAYTLRVGVDAWFSAPVKQSLSGAVNISELYLNEHENSLATDVAQIAYSLQNDPELRAASPDRVASLLLIKLKILTEGRGLQSSTLYDSNGTWLGDAKKTEFVKDLPPPSAEDIKTARQGRLFIDLTPQTGVASALYYLPAFNDAYLRVVRLIDPTVLAYYKSTRVAASEYDKLNQNRADIQAVFASLYAVVSLVILLVAIWSGLWLATRFVQPISNLVDAAERVTEGDLKARVEVTREDDEIGTLGVAFNRMTSQLDGQRSQLVLANEQIDERRRFTETVLAGVSAGVIGVDRDGQITIVNRTAARLLNAAPEEMEGLHYSVAIPEVGALIRRAMSEPVARASGEVSIKRTGNARALSVQVAREDEYGDSGFVVTFDDITDLVSAQRTAAWADVARRIAHEIKNPLTPIQLAAERLMRKYGDEITSDPETFKQCTDTIIRQVGDIGRMVDEFSSFARMPTPVMRRESAQELLHQAVFLQRVANPQIAFVTNAPHDPLYFEGDGRLISQALTNVLKNAGEGISARLAKGEDAPGRISISIEPNGQTVAFKVMDNGIGLPAEHRHRLTEPYVTTRAKGTGLGLAIVRKIMEDHGGDIALADAEEHGAEVTLTFPLQQKDQRQKGTLDEQERISRHV